MKYKAILFDMDGTILNTALDIEDCVNLFLEKFGYPKRSDEEILSGLGGGSRNLIKHMLPEGHSDKEFSDFFEEYLPYYETHGKDKTKPFDGILELLIDLKKDGLKLAVVSSKPQKGVDALCEYYFKGIFDIAVGDIPGRKLKPDPEPILFALNFLGINKNDALYVGDSEYDIQAAKNTSIDGAVATWGYRKKDELLKLQPKYVVNSAEELRDLIYEK